jgi:PTS system mannose-specific IIA component
MNSAASRPCVTSTNPIILSTRLYRPRATDLFGGTPSNLAISLMKGENVEVIAGVNLPMLIRLEGARKVMPVHAAVAAAREAGRKYISVASEILGEAAA